MIIFDFRIKLPFAHQDMVTLKLLIDGRGNNSGSTVQVYFQKIVLVFILLQTVKLHLLSTIFSHAGLL